MSTNENLDSVVSQKGECGKQEKCITNPCASVSLTKCTSNGSPFESKKWKADPNIGLSSRTVESLQKNKSKNDTVMSIFNPENERKIPQELPPETWSTILRNMLIPFILAGLGMVGAGFLLDHVQEWNVYIDVHELMLLVTPFLGLKGNVQMTLASRLATQANIGNMDKPRERWKIIFGNLALDQLQAIVCGSVASCFVLGITMINSGHWHLNHVVLLTSASILTASTVSIILASVMVIVIELSRRFNINPDNIATPIAGSLGDVVTLYLLSLITNSIWSVMKEGNFFIPYIIYGAFALILPIFVIIVYKNKYVKKALITGWVPIIVSVAISTGAGLCLDTSRYDNISLFQPLMNGIGGNIVSVQASRISTQLHSECEERILPSDSRICSSPLSVFTGGRNAASARTFLVLIVPSQAFFVTISWVVSLYPIGKSYDLVFLTLFLIAAVIQVLVLLYLAKFFSSLMWILGQDPDIATIPILTATGDLLGSCALYLVFKLHRLVLTDSTLEHW